MLNVLTFLSISFPTFPLFYHLLSIDEEMSVSPLDNQSNACYVINGVILWRRKLEQKRGFHAYDTLALIQFPEHCGGAVVDHRRHRIRRVVHAAGRAGSPACNAVSTGVLPGWARACRCASDPGAGGLDPRRRRADERSAGLPRARRHLGCSDPDARWLLPIRGWERYHQAEPVHCTALYRRGVARSRGRFARDRPAHHLENSRYGLQPTLFFSMLLR